MLYDRESRMDWCEGCESYFYPIQSGWWFCIGIDPLPDGMLFMYTASIDRRIVHESVKRWERMMDLVSDGIQSIHMLRPVILD